MVVLWWRGKGGSAECVGGLRKMTGDWSQRGDGIAQTACQTLLNLDSLAVRTVLSLRAVGTNDYRVLK